MTARDPDLETDVALALALAWDRPPLDVAAENRAARLDAHRCCFCRDFCAPGDRIACATHRARLDAETMPWDDRSETAP